MVESYDDKQSRLAERDKERDQEAHGREVKIGEIIGKTTREIKKEVSGTKIRIDHVEELYFQPKVDLKQGDSFKVTIAADWTKRDQVQHVVFSQRPDNIGEALGKITKDTKSSNDLNIRIDGAEKMKFKPSVDLKKGDSVRITIEKV